MKIFLYIRDRWIFWSKQSQGDPGNFQFACHSKTIDDQIRHIAVNIINRSLSHRCYASYSHVSFIEVIPNNNQSPEIQAVNFTVGFFVLRWLHDTA